MKTVKKRRRQNVTDYKARMGLLKSGMPRIVFRKTNKYVVGQYVTSSAAQDKVVLNISSKMLMNYGWPKEMQGSLKSTPATYLTGMLAGKKIIKGKLKTPIVDFGMIRVIDKGKVHAFLKGLVDAGLNIKVKDSVFPSEDRIRGKHAKKGLAEKFDEIKSKIEKE